jgi:hypothetical protein
MSKSAKDYRDNRDVALRRMAEATEDRIILQVLFRPNDEDFADILDTTWSQLEADSHIRPANRKGPIEYRLTGRGWIDGLRLSDRWEAKDFRTKAGQLSAALKRHVKKTNRKDEFAFTDLETLCQDSKLHEGFVYNAIEGHLLQELYGVHDAEWDPDGKPHIIIPNTFGVPI